MTPPPLFTVVTHDAPGARQMALDEDFRRRAAALGDAAFARVYRFDPPCVTLGYFQKAGSVDAEAIASAGLDLVRRPTGGRAVLHRDTLTYMVAAGARSPLFAGGLHPSMRRIARALEAAFATFGLATALESGRGKATGGTAACFDAPSFLELRVDDRKLAGSAQARGADGFLQHGAIPFRYDAEENRRLLGAPARPATACAPFLALPGNTERFAERFFAALAAENGLTLLPDPEPLPSDAALAPLAARYADPAFTRRR